MSQIDSTIALAPPIRVPKSEFVAGRLSLAFCNTVTLPNAADRLADPAGLAGWAGRAGHPIDLPLNADAHAAFLNLRDHLGAVFGALSDHQAPPQASLDAIASAAAPLRLAWNRRAGHATPVVSGDALARLRQAIVADALDLLTTDTGGRIKRCPAHDCRWFFLDTSRNGTRRWCAMADCGVKDKVQRFRTRQSLSRHAAF